MEKAASRKRRRLGGAAEAERCLELAVFGGAEELLGALRTEEPEGSGEQSEGEQEPGAPRPEPAWRDEEEADPAAPEALGRHRRELARGAAERSLPRERLQARLREAFRRAMGGAPAWAERGAAAEAGGLERSTGELLRGSPALPPGVLSLHSCPPANQARPGQARLSSVHFHPGAAVLLAAGLDGDLGLFQVDGSANPLLQSVQLERFPVHRARFTPDGQHVLATGLRSRRFYVYDMLGGAVTPVLGVRGLHERLLRGFELSPDGALLLLTGTAGFLHMLSLRTRELIGSVKVNGRATAAAFSADSSRVYSSTDEGQVYVWDVRSRRCLHRFADEGCLRATSLAVSSNGHYLACGSSAGVVNIYAHDDCMQHANPKPLKAVMNLVTAATSLAFNPTTEILAVASNAADDAVRLVHIPSFTVFSNFPVFRKKTINLAQCMDFSPGSGFFSIANNKGKALLYRLKHYSDF